MPPVVGSPTFGTSAREAGDMLAAMQQSYGMSRDQALGLADAMNHLSNNMASSAPELMDFWTRVAADAGRAGFSQEQAIALGSAMIASGNGADVAATSFRNMTRSLTRGESATERQQAAYERLGLTAEDVALRMQQDAVGTTREVLEAISLLPAEVRAAVSSDLFGDEARALGSIATNLEFFDRAVGAVADEAEYAGSAMREFEVRANTSENAMTLLMNRVSELSIMIGDALVPAMTSIIDVLGPIVTQIADLARAHPDLTAAIVGTAGAFVALKVAAAGLTFVGLVGKGGALSLLAGGLRALTFLGTPVAGFFETLRMRNALAARSLGTTPGLLARIGDAALVLARGIPGVSMFGSALAGLAGGAATISAPV
jgi:TP901 family phage tail tape measure protein